MKKTIILTALALNLALMAHAQTTGSTLNGAIFTVCEVPPAFPGGRSELDSFIRQNLRYPEKALKKKTQGDVHVTFIVTDDGSIEQVEVLKSPGRGTAEETVRLINSMPKWIPGRQSGRLVNAKYAMVVPFTIIE
ncbi:energy transducer TonB [Spirosoma arcticum]